MNHVQGLATFYVTMKTEMEDEEFQRKFHKDNIVGVKVQFVTSDGEVHSVDLADVMNLDLEFEDEDKKSHQANA